ncbi:sulfite exporter TauE/SafE family protein [Mesorhizobium sp. M2C.T.Ca.TU.002.02.1.1]|uniref:sulfite exporter TauE/SafE family protein n=1 Tax=Mesorhizobium sp. M2C.T.Ca.TU.002.02.1.1 TaxID=2496788 RepID=UPI000FC99D45|nr:sulfite exporter TauE/SafE family protein [Mesorhizobium sp. M2C.T.Ca.TU.002.02.1.1]RUU59829.1 sulfite exporter TauE/SafE family protein [Mesorhizobium sp. M2C.T.Ca.TU.002.02.1.1]RUU70911.1 sulfite exporter TauE/SafE family protein [Mesorhizobium sp. M2C.T.Ca.TU.009.01.2.1]
MTDYFPPHLLIVVLTFFLAGIVKGVAGMGLPTVAMGILGAIMSPVSAASLLVIPSFVTNLWQLLTGPDCLALTKRFSLMMLGIVVGTLAGTWLLTSVDTEYASVGLGSALILYAVHGLWAKPLSIPARRERLLSPVIGLATGAINGATGVFTLPAVPYLQALGLSKDNLIQALGLSFTVSTIALAAGLARGGAFHLGNVTLSALAVIPSLLGMWVGTAVRERISAAIFRRSFLILLAILGLELAVHPFFL